MAKSSNSELLAILYPIGWQQATWENDKPDGQSMISVEAASPAHPFPTARLPAATTNIHFSIVHFGCRKRQFDAVDREKEVKGKKGVAEREGFEPSVPL